MDFTSLLIEYTKDYESPTSFWKWSAYSAIAATLRHNVYYSHKIGKIYPNTYTVLLANSAASRKGAPCNVINSLIAEVKNTKTFTGSASVQAIIDKLSQDIGNNKTGVPLRGGSCLILAEELAAFFVEDPRLLPLLTRMYDYAPEFPYDLRSGSIIVKDLCVTLLAASNETFLRDVYTARAVYGGLLRRTLLIKADEKRKGNSLFGNEDTKSDAKSDSQRKTLVNILTDISKLKGEVTLTKEAASLYDTWYNSLYSSYDSHGSSTGVLEGIHSLVAKIAIILAASQCKLEISKDNVEQAILEVTALKSNYEIYSMSAGHSSDAKIGTLILDSLYKSPGYILRRRDLLLKHWYDISTEQLDELVNRFTGAGLIEFAPVGSGLSAEPGYKLTQKCIEIFESKKAAGNGSKP